MFKKGDYIVLLEGSFDHCYPINFIFKQREENMFLRTEKDNRGSITNGWDVHSFDKSWNNNWRYATQIEREEYERLGKPFDVTKIVYNGMFMKNDYIVLLNFGKGVGEPSYYLNHVYKQNSNREYLDTYLDSRGSSTNCWGAIKFLKTDGVDWRYATRKEIEQYNHLGKPYDIKSLVIASQAPAIESKFNIGDIVETDSTGYQYSQMNKNHSTPLAEIVNCGIRTYNHQGKKVLDKQYSFVQKQWWYHVDGYSTNWITENCMSKPDPMLELLAEAKHRYPVGSKFYPAHLDVEIAKTSQIICIVKDHSLLKIDRTSLTYGSGDTLTNGHSYSEHIYYEGEWAEIVSTPEAIDENEELSLKVWRVEPKNKKELLNEAVKRFPKGTVFKNTNIIPHCVGTVIASGSPYWSGDDIMINTLTSTYTIYNHQGWAEVIPPVLPVITSEIDDENGDKNAVWKLGLIHDSKYYTRPDLIKEAQRRGYNPGAKFIDLVRGEEFTIRNPFGDEKIHNDSTSNNQLYVQVEQHATLANKSARMYRDGYWAKLVKPAMGQSLSSQKPSKFLIGDVIDTDKTGYQYTDMQKNHNTNWSEIISGNARTSDQTQLRIFDKVFSVTQGIWWYKTDHYLNWITEQGMRLHGAKESVIYHSSIDVFGQSQEAFKHENLIVNGANLHQAFFTNPQSIVEIPNAVNAFIVSEHVWSPPVDKAYDKVMHKKRIENDLLNIQHQVPLTLAKKKHSTKLISL
jgi:hypothetical protein